MNVWTDNQGQQMRVSHMSDGHLINCLLWLVSDQNCYPEDMVNGKSVIEWVVIFMKERADRFEILKRSLDENS